MQRELVILIISLLALVGKAQDTDRATDSGSRLIWTVNGAWSFNMPVGDIGSDDRYDDSIYSGPSEEGGVLGAGVRLSWKRGWWIESGLNFGYNSAQVIPADIDQPVYGLRRLSISLPITGGWYYPSLIGQLGIGPKAGIEIIGNMSMRCKNLEHFYNISSSELWRRWNLAAVMGVEWGFSFIRADILLHIGLFPLIHRKYNYTVAGSSYYQLTVGAKFLF